MNDFREAYQKTMQDIPTYSIDADSVLNEARHRKVVARRRRQTMMSSVLTLCLVCLFAAGTTKAAGLFGNVIKATDRGFVTGDTETMEMALAEEAAETALAEGTGKARSMEEAPAEKVRSQEAPAEAEAVSEEPGSDAMGENEPEVMFVEDTIREYDSVAAFRAAEDTAVIALPEAAEIMTVRNEGEAEEASEETTEGTKEIQISVMSDGDMVMFSERTADGKMISVRATDYASTEGHSSSTVYGGEVTNEREYMTEAGYTYTIIDTTDEAGNYEGLHAAIAVGTYEIITDFWGYSEEDALQMLESIDLSVYLSGGENEKKEETE